MSNATGFVTIEELRAIRDEVMLALDPPPPFRRWVRTDDCRVLVFEQDLRAREGFRLLNAAGEAWDGGKGASDAWEFLETSDISPEVQERFGWLKPAKESA